ncbi:hypothetical protein [Herbidospora mongoliensis]|uniref:hypothetical protein n=1 Tax=Herbidospora mongoliensis TaxID=688067 RepID=UPI00082C2ECD|nr:hypothetical protein [Herbidospora mongoliensis]
MIPRPVFDPALGEPITAQVTAALDRRDWPAARGLLAGADPGVRAFTLRVAASRPGLLDSIGRHDDAAALLLRGAHEVITAWRARPAEGQAAFAARLKAAEVHLSRAVEADVDDPHAWTWLVNTATGRGLDRSEARRRFDEAVKRDPGHHDAHVALLRNLSATWGGSHRGMFAFARETALTARPGTCLPALIPTAHLEHLWSGDADTLRTAEVVAELRAAALTSVLHPVHVDGPVRLVSLSWFALAFVMAGDHESARQIFGLLGDVVTEHPWKVYGDPVETFTTMREKVGQV